MEQQVMPEYDPSRLVLKVGISVTPVEFLAICDDAGILEFWKSQNLEIDFGYDDHTYYLELRGPAEDILSIASGLNQLGKKIPMAEA